jgi:hypothetical protein
MSVILNVLFEMIDSVLKFLSLNFPEQNKNEKKRKEKKTNRLLWEGESE